MRGPPAWHLIETNLGQLSSVTHTHTLAEVHLFTDATLVTDITPQHDSVIISSCNDFCLDDHGYTCVLCDAAIAVSCFSGMANRGVYPDRTPERAYCKFN